MPSGVKCAQLLVAALLLPNPTPEALSARAPMVILKEAAQRYSGLRSYHFVSTIQIATADGSREETMGHVVAGTADGKTRHEMDTPLGRWVVVSDGETQWTYFPAANEYVVTAPGSGPLPNLGQVLIRSYATIDSSVVRAEWLRAEDLSLGGTPVTCDVIRVDGQPGWPAVEDAEADRLWRAEWMNVPKTYWIDRQQRRILRVVATSAKGARQETTYSVARVNEELPAVLFTSPVPPGAKKMESPR